MAGIYVPEYQDNSVRELTESTSSLINSECFNNTNSNPDPFMLRVNLCDMLIQKNDL